MAKNKAVITANKASRTGIRWREDDLKELRRAVKNYNQKLDYVRKKDPVRGEYQPERVYFQNLKNNITTRADLNRTINSLKRYSTRGAEATVINKKGTVVTQYELKELAIRLRAENRRKRRLRKLIGEGYDNPDYEDTTFDRDNITEKGFDRLLKGLNKRASDEYKKKSDRDYYFNYLGALKRDVYPGMEEEEQKELEEELQKIGLPDFVRYSTTDPTLSIKFIYDSYDIEGGARTIYNEILEGWRFANKQVEEERNKRSYRNREKRFAKDNRKGKGKGKGKRKNK